MMHYKIYRKWILLFILMSIVHTNCNQKLESKNNKLTIAIQVSPAMTLVMVAEDKGFFEKAGVSGT